MESNHPLWPTVADTTIKVNSYDLGCVVAARSDPDADLPHLVEHGGPIRTLELYIPHLSDGWTYHLKVKVCEVHANLAVNEQAWMGELEG